MSTLETHMRGGRVAARNADRRKKLLLVGLLVLLAGLLAFQLPKLLNHSGSSSSTAPPVTTTAPGAAAAAGGRSTTKAATPAPANRDRAIQRMTPRDPFVPLIRESAPASAPSSARTSAPASAPSSAPTSTPAPRPTFHFAPPAVAPAASAPTEPPAVKPGLVRPADPTAAVIWTNGERQIVGVKQTFHVADATFKLAAVTRTAMHLQVADGSFTGGKGTITIPKGRSVILENNATGVRYTLRFAGGTTDTPAVQPTDAPKPSNPAEPTSSAPSGSKSTSNGS